MKSRRLAIGLFVTLCLACMVGVLALWMIHSQMFYSSPENESMFLRSYTPEHVIEHFRDDESSQMSRHIGGGSGHVFVEHQAGFDFYFVLRPEKWMPLMNALRDDALQQLAKSRAEITSESGNPHDGFHFDYKLNNSIGSLTILPLALAPPGVIQRNRSLPQGMEDVTVKIEQTEKWYPKGGVTLADLFR